MQKELKIYLAGSIAGRTESEIQGWRREIKAKLYEYALDNIRLKVINPANYFSYENEDEYFPQEIMLWELNHVRTSDVVIVNLENINQSIGTAIELYTAYENNVPVIAYNPKHMAYKDVHSWLRVCITKVIEDSNELGEYIKNYYM